jgi:hypothetical protein
MGRPNRILAAAVAVLLAVVGVATAFAVTRTPERVEAGSAVATVQAYLTAIADQDPTAAGALLDPAGRCAASDVEMAYLPEQFRAVLVSQDVGAGSATVRVEIREGTGDPFGGDYGHEEVFRLVRTDGEWRLSGAPWPMGWCGGSVAP